MRPPIKRAAMMNTTTTDSSIPKKSPLRRSPNFPFCSSSDPGRSESPPPSPGPAGDVSPPGSPPSTQDPDGSEMQRLVDEWGDTFVPDTEEVVGDVAAVDSGAALWAGCVVPDTYDEVGSPVADLSGQPSVDNVQAEDRKQEIWEAAMLKMLGRMKAKEERHRVEKLEAAVAVDEKIDHMLVKMKAKENLEKQKS